MAPRKRSISRNLGLAAVLPLVASVLACKGEQPCGSLARLCADEGRWRVLATPVDDAVLLDLDGDGADESVVLSREAQKLSLAYDSGSSADRRQALYLEGVPVGLEALRGEVAVALAEPPRVAIFGLDADGRLERRRDIALSAGPAVLRGGDLDGDGAPELVASLPDAGKLAIVDPRASEVREYAVGSRPWALAVGDVDDDGHRDVITIDGGGDVSPGVTGERALHVLRGAGDGTLKPSPSSPSAAAIYNLELADHDGDGDLDALARTPVSDVLVHRNDGGGRFSSPAALPFFGVLPHGPGMAVGPVAGSGLVGVSLPQGNVMSTWFGKGAAWLGHVEEYIGGLTTWVGAGPGDLVLVGGESSLERFAWQPSATPIEVWRSDAVSSDFNDLALATGAINVDHLLDFAVAVAGALHLFHGRADLGFDLAARVELDGPATAIVIADVTGDGRSDIVLNEGPHVRAVFGGDDGEYVVGPSFAVGVPALALVPLRTGPDQPVAIVAMPRPPAQAVEEPGAAVMRFAADGAVTVDVLTDALFVDALVAVDLDEDDVDEPLILGRRDDLTVLTRMTPAAAGFSPGAEHDLEALSGLAPEVGFARRLSAADVDGDGQPEVFAWVGSGALRITGLLDDAPEVTRASNMGAPTHFRDVDGDGRLDAVYLADASFGYRRGGGDGTFAEDDSQYWFPRAHALALASVAGAQFDVVELAYDVVATHLVREVVRPVEAADTVYFHEVAVELVGADLDLDGHDDLVTLSSEGVGWMWGSEREPLDRVDGHSKFNSLRTIAVGDLDGDGHPEVLSASSGGWIRGYRVHPWREDLYLRFEGESLSGSFGRLACADVDADGRTDILALVGAGDTLELHVARAAAEPFHYDPWTPAATVPVREFATLEVGDVDDDGDLDVLIDRESNPGVLVRNEGARAWAEPEVLPGEVAMFSSADAGGRVELVTQEGTTIYRHTKGEPDRRTPLVRDEAARLLRAADADGDGRYDLVVVEEEAAFVWLRGDDGSTRIQLTEAPIFAVDFPDIDGDRRPDLVALNGNGMFIRRTRPSP